MNASIQRQISLWLSIAIVGLGICGAATSFFVAYRAAMEAQDKQLGQVAAALSHGSYKDVPPDMLPKDAEDAEGRFVVAPLGSRAAPENSSIDLTLPETSPDGLQTVEQKGVAWRFIIVHDSFGERFGVGQSMEAREEYALAGALFILVPLALLAPILLVAVHLIIRRSFASIAELSSQVDHVDGTSLLSLDTGAVPSELLPFVQAVNRLLERLGTALEQQRRLVADAAHELRSPLAALMVQAENVQKALVTEQAKERVATLRGGLQRLASLQDQLLNFARVQKSAVAASEPLSLNDIVRTTIEDLLPMAIQKNIDLGCTHLEDVRIIGDLRHTTSLVRNAIDNAVRYTPAGGSVDVSVAKEGRAACLVVEDTGPGIDQSDIPRVFEPFVRVLGSKETGSGLGLAIVRAAADAMGGTVELATRRDQRSGLRFIYRQAAASI